MKKKILFGALIALGAVVALPMFSAFEAHVINVTARIENALSVNTKHINFGTVFPQEHLDQPLDVALSGSFMAEGRVDDVKYFIRQKPKCAWSWTTRDGTTADPVYTIDEGSTRTGHPRLDPVGKEYIDCGDAPVRPDGVPTDAVWGPLPLLCPYISKHPDGEPRNDGITPAFHEPWHWNGHELMWNDTLGYLAKSVADVRDRWTIDLAVPCFGGYCAQDWADFVHKHNTTADPAQYTQPIENEHKIFGCDLWVEVSGVSTTTSLTTGTLIVVKHVVNNTQNVIIEKIAADFTIDISNSSNPSLDMFAGAEMPGVSVTVDPGAYSVDEVADFGYDKTLSSDCVGVIAAGETKTCTITNTEPLD